MSKLKKLLVTSLSAALLAASIVPVTSAMIKASATENWSNVDIDQEYIVDEKLSVPARTLTVGGETYDATIKITYPGGTTRTIESGDLLLSAPGEYTITYEVRANGKKYSETEEFFVANKLWSVKNEKSSVTYGTVGKTDALLVRLAKNDVLTFNKVVDLADYSSKEALVKGFINPDSVGSNDCEAIIIKVTDAYDPAQVLTIRGYKSSSSVHTVCGSYWTAAGPNQTLAGWDSNARRYSIRTEIPDGICGTYRGVSFCSISGRYNNTTGLFDQSNVTADVESFSVHFDTDTKVVSVSDKNNSSDVADLDKPEYYEAEPLWKGFTSGKVTISVMADGYASETANFAISKVFGYDDLSVDNVFVEEEPPILTVDAEEKYVEYNAKLDRYSFSPLAVVGGNYPVPNATAFDGYSGDVKVETKVYFDYSNTKQQVTIKDSTFAVTQKGTYAIVYTAKDHMGNTVERIYWVNAVDALENPLAMTVNKADATTSAVCGEKVALASYTTVGGSGDANVTITATCGDTTLDVSKGSLLAEKEGVWTITYTAMDYAGIKVVDSYTINVVLGDKPVFVEAPVFPKYIISGMEYVVPTVYAYDYTSGTKVEKIASLRVTDANGTKVYEAGQAYTPVVDDNGNMDLTFVCESATMPMNVKAVAPRSGDFGVYIERMFITEDYNITRDKSGLTMEATKEGTADWMFANVLAAENAALYIKGIQGSSIFEGMTVTFTDYADSSIAVTMKVVHGKTGTLRVQFGNTDRELTKGLNLGIDDKGRALNEITFSYKLGKFYVDNLGVTVATDDNGNAFEGFPSGRVYMSAEIFGAKEGQKYIIEQIDNHIIGASARDRATPRIAINGEYGGIYDVKSEYVVGSALASDVIDPNVNCTVTVTRPNGAIMTDVNGLALEDVAADKEYVIKLTEYGQYQVTYKSVDWAGEEGISTYAVNIFDQKAPKLSLKGDFATTAKVGDTVELPLVEVTDDYSDVSEISVYRSVRNPYDVLTVFGYDKENTVYRFTFKYAGEYKFVIVACDAAGNQTYLEYVVTVS